VHGAEWLAADWMSEGGDDVYLCRCKCVFVKNYLKKWKSALDKCIKSNFKWSSNRREGEKKLIYAMYILQRRKWENVNNYIKYERGEKKNKWDKTEKDMIHL
jgi:hypothetical protein